MEANGIRTRDLLLAKGVGRRSSIPGFPGLFRFQLVPTDAPRLSDFAARSGPFWPQIGLSGLFLGHRLSLLKELPTIVAGPMRGARSAGLFPVPARETRACDTRRHIAQASRRPAPSGMSRPPGAAQHGVDGDAIDFGRPAVGTDLAPGPPEHVAAGDISGGPWGPISTARTTRWRPGSSNGLIVQNLRTGR